MHCTRLIATEHDLKTSETYFYLLAISKIRSTHLQKINKTKKQHETNRWKIKLKQPELKEIGTSNKEKFNKQYNYIDCIGTDF